MDLINRRQFVAAGSASALALGAPQLAHAQAKPKLRFSAAFPETDLRAEGYKAFAAAMQDDFDFEPYWANTLFKQGTELVALQRDNLELCNLAPADISKQVPVWSLMTSAYLFRDYDHLNKTFKSEVGQDFIKLARDQLGIELIRPVYFGARQINLKPTKKINTPADMAGIKLRMPNGDAWQFLGTALGANPTPMAYAEVYTGLQTGAIDGQDNPLPNVENMKFYEVMKQIVLTSHLVGYDLLVISKTAWDAMTPEQQASVQAAASAAIDMSQEKHIAREVELLDKFKAGGLNIYEPDVAAFRAHVQEQYLQSELAKSWEAGIVEKINAL